LSALVAFELKIGKFTPKDLGQLSFYLEVLDRDVKKNMKTQALVSCFVVINMKK
jgi:hypothetical protein